MNIHHTVSMKMKMSEHIIVLLFYNSFAIASILFNRWFAPLFESGGLKVSASSARACSRIRRLARTER